LPESAVDSAVAGILGGMAGAKLLWVFEHLGEEPALDLILSRGGMSWFGGLAGGVLAGLAVMQWKRFPKDSHPPASPCIRRNFTKLRRWCRLR
jgi:prolipoprotein diacylglyceryltransferase